MSTFHISEDSGFGGDEFFQVQTEETEADEELIEICVYENCGDSEVEIASTHNPGDGSNALVASAISQSGKYRN